MRPVPGANALEPTSLELHMPMGDKARATPSGAKNGAKPMKFTFDRVFDSASSQGDVFQEVSQMTQSAIDGYKVAIFAYGQTGSGKTHTMTGSSDAPGIIPRASSQVRSHTISSHLVTSRHISSHLVTYLRYHLVPGPVPRHHVLHHPVIARGRHCPSPTPSPSLYRYSRRLVSWLPWGGRLSLR